MLQGSKPAIFQKSADLRITSKKLETKSIFIHLSSYGATHQKAGVIK